MKHHRALAPVLLLAFASVASAQLDTPTLQPGKFVYAIPDTFSPPLIEKAGMAEMDRELAKLKFPFYLFLIDGLPGSERYSKYANGWRSRLADENVTALANRLRAQAGFDQNRASVFLLSFDPKAYAYRPGSEWKTKYGFVTAAHAPYIALFKKYASNPANDPKQGILEMAKAIDAHLDDISDAVKVAARQKEAARQRAAAEHEAKLAAERRKSNVLLLMGGLAVFVIGMAGASLRRKHAALRRQIADALATHRTHLTNARQQAFRLFEERDAVAGASGFQGRTKEVYDRVASDLDAMVVALEAMAQHGDAVEKEAAKGSMMNLAPVTAALSGIDAPFDFDTGKVNRNDLFGTPTETVKVNPETFTAEMGQRFQETSQAWEHLKSALELRGQSIEGALPHSRLTELQGQLAELGLNPAWLTSHPLAGDDASDRAAYAALTDLLWKDPVAGLERVEEVKRWEEETAQSFALLRESRKAVDAARLSAVPTFITAAVSPGDDPETLLSYAKEEEADFRRLLAASLSADEILAAADEATLSYGLCRESVEVLRRAVAEANGEVASLPRALAAEERQIQAAQAIVDDTGTRHKAIGAARALLVEAATAFVLAEHDANDARDALELNRHLEAARRAHSCHGHLADSEAKCKEAIRLCDELESQREQYEAKLREMSVLHSNLAIEAAGYGRGNVLSPYQPQYTSGPLDYALMYVLLNQQEQSWRTSVADAQVSYQAEQPQDNSWSSSGSDGGWSSSDSSSSGDSGGSFDSGGSSGDSSGSW